MLSTGIETSSIAKRWQLSYSSNLVRTVPVPHFSGQSATHAKGLDHAKIASIKLHTIDNAWMKVHLQDKHVLRIAN